MSDTTAELRCLDVRTGACSGMVEYRTPLSASGKSFPRCAHHWRERLTAQDRNSRAYPDSPVAPAWVDESYAGERWEED